MVAARRLVPSVVVLQRHLSLHATIPTKLEAAFARDVVAVLGRFEAAAVGASLGAGLPTHRHGVAPSLVLTFLHFLLFSLGVHTLLLLFTRNARVWPLLTTTTKPMTLLARKVTAIVAIIHEDPLLATSLLTLEDVRVVTRQELQEFIVSLLGEALVEDMDRLLRAQVVATTVHWACKFAQTSLPDNDVEVIL